MDDALHLRLAAGNERARALDVPADLGDDELVVHKLEAMHKADAQLGGDQPPAIGECDIVPLTYVVDVRCHGCICTDPMLLHEGEKVGLGQVRGRASLVTPDANALDGHLLPNREVRNGDVIHLARELNAGEAWINDLATAQGKLFAIQFQPHFRLEELAVATDSREEVARDHVIQPPTLTDLGLRTTTHGSNRRVITHVDTFTCP
mmetsp:Transcript_24905/g.50507  ORF Transcript_24905/g.50507 Transcript_24905/m.50507 type:complete len:206 (+) Transcript_24905:830-1447(+)